MPVQKSLKRKFASSIATLILLVFISIGTVLTLQTKKQIESDIYFQTRSLAELTASNLVQSAENYLLKDNQIAFQREIEETFSKSPDLNSIQVYNFANEKIYQSSDIVTTPDQSRIQANLPSISTLDGQVIYLNKKAPGDYEYVDPNLTPIPEISLPKHIVVQDIYFPVDQKYTVIYQLKYDNLKIRLFSQAITLATILALALLVSIIFGYILSLVVTRPILKLNTAVKDIAHGNFEHRVDIKTADEVGELGQSVNQMAEDLTQATEAKIYKSRVEKELELAKKIQENILPKSIPTIQGLDISGIVLPATEIGGDVYDVLVDSTTGDLLTYVGDVTGHGVPAGILSAISNSVIVSLQNNDLVHIANNLNKILKTKATPNMFITAAFAKYTQTNPNQLQYLSAGHEQLIHYKAATKQATMLPSGGIALGMFPDVTKLLKTQLVPDFQPGDSIILYSDGIPEAWKNETETFGFDRLVSSLQTHASSKPSISAQDLKQAILTDIQTFTSGYEQKDDITLLILKRT